MDNIKVNLVDYIFDALETAKNTHSILPHLPPNTKPIHFRILNALYKIRDNNGNARITDINKELQFLLPNTTKCINELQKLGLIEKATLPTDMRVVLVHTTELGEQYTEEYIKKYHNRLQEEFEKIGEADCIVMIEAINKVYDAVQKVYQK